jgi:hypothetical protein
MGLCLTVRSAQRQLQRADTHETCVQRLATGRLNCIRVLAYPLFFGIYGSKIYVSGGRKDVDLVPRLVMGPAIRVI